MQWLRNYRQLRVPQESRGIPYLLLIFVLLALTTIGLPLGSPQLAIFVLALPLAIVTIRRLLARPGFLLRVPED